MQRARRISPRILIGCTALAVAGCDHRVHLGDIGDGAASLLWSATFEPGNLSEWEGDGKGGTYVENVTAPPAATTDMAHKGRYAGIATVTPMGGMASLDYLFRDQPSPPEAYYSAWFFISPSFSVKSWLSLTHFRCSHSGDGSNLFPIWDVNLYPRPDGSLVAHLYNYVTQTNLEETTPTPVPIGSWVQFEVLLSKAPDSSGHIAVWQDGVLILDEPGVATAETDWVEWDAGGSSDNLAPSPGVVYIDDAAISLTRVGPGG